MMWTLTMLVSGFALAILVISSWDTNTPSEFVKWLMVISVIVFATSGGRVLWNAIFIGAKYLVENSI